MITVTCDRCHQKVEGGTRLSSSVHILDDYYELCDSCKREYLAVCEEAHKLGNKYIENWLKGVK